MDNLSHSLFGLAAGQLVQRLLPPEANDAAQRTRGRLLLTAAWAGSNFPDLDLVLTGLLPEPLGYLLHHRGHTHTLLYALPQIALLLALIWLPWPNARRLLRTSSLARLGLGLCAAGGMLLHIGFDALNSYGVHPFHPFDGRWLYGDLVFILEPVFWVAFGVPLALSLHTRWLRALVLWMLAGVALFAWIGYLLWSAVAVLAALALLLVWVHRPASARALAGGMLAALAFVGVQAAAGHAARQQFAAARPGSAPLDVALTAYPANPLCWSFVAVAREGGKVKLSGGAVSAAPDWLPVGRCPAALQPLPAGAQALVTLWTHDSDLATLQHQARVDCHFSAWLRFARMPALFDGAATDARFGLAPSSNFSTLRFTESAARPCPAGLPGWGMPRADLLR